MVDRSHAYACYGCAGQTTVERIKGSAVRYRVTCLAPSCGATWEVKR